MNGTNFAGCNYFCPGLVWFSAKLLVSSVLAPGIDNDCQNKHDSVKVSLQNVLFWAADQLLFSSSQPAQLQSYVLCWGGRPLQLLFRIFFYNYYRPQPSVSESFDELEEEELGTKGD